MLIGEVTVAEAAAGRAALQAMLITLTVGTVLLVPSLIWLYVLFQRSPPAPQAPIAPDLPEPSAATPRRPFGRSSPNRPRPLLRYQIRQAIVQRSLGATDIQIALVPSVLPKVGGGGLKFGGSERLDKTGRVCVSGTDCVGQLAGSSSHHLNIVTDLGRNRIHQLLVRGPNLVGETLHPGAVLLDRCLR